MDYFDMAGDALIKDLKEFTYQVELLHKKLIENKNNKNSFSVAQNKSSLKILLKNVSTPTN